MFKNNFDKIKEVYMKKLRDIGFLLKRVSGWCELIKEEYICCNGV